VISYIYILFTILLTCYGQLVLKWRLPIHGTLPEPFWQKLFHLLSLFIDPFILSGFVAAFMAALCYMAALSKLPLSHAYPFMGITFGIVLLGSALFFNEPLNLYKVAGVLLIIAGIALGSQG
jgi:multidrug transporter EmrE-like cation transporter